MANARPLLTAKVDNARLEICLADITTLRVDAVVNAANSTLLGGGAGDDELLASCYRTALDLAAAHRLASIAFPAISTGIYGFPRTAPRLLP